MIRQLFTSCKYKRFRTFNKVFNPRFISVDSEKDEKDEKENVNKYVAKNLMKDLKLISLTSVSSVIYNGVGLSLLNSGVVGVETLSSFFYPISVISLISVLSVNSYYELNEKYIKSVFLGIGLSPFVFFNPVIYDISCLMTISYIGASLSSQYFITRNTQSISRNTYPRHLSVWAGLGAMVGYQVGFFDYNSSLYLIPIMCSIYGYMDNRNLINNFYDKKKKDFVENVTYNSYLMGIVMLSTLRYENQIKDFMIGIYGG